MPPPSTQYKTVQGGSLFDVSVPQNWEAVSSTNAVKFVPQNGYGIDRGRAGGLHARRRARSRARLVARSAGRDAHLDLELRAEQP